MRCTALTGRVGGAAAEVSGVKGQAVGGFLGAPQEGLPVGCVAPGQQGRLNGGGVAHSKACRGHLHALASTIVPHTKKMEACEEMQTNRNSKMQPQCPAPPQCNDGKRQKKGNCQKYFNKIWSENVLVCIHCVGSPEMQKKGGQQGGQQGSGGACLANLDLTLCPNGKPRNNYDLGELFTLSNLLAVGPQLPQVCHIQAMYAIQTHWCFGRGCPAL